MPTRAIPAARCNIGPAELDRRRRIAIVLTVLTIAAAGVLIAADLPQLDRLVIWPLAAGMAVTWLQVARRFCVRFGAAGLENFGELGRESPVEARARIGDRNRALAMIAEGALIGLLATLVLVAVRL